MSVYGLNHQFQDQWLDVGRCYFIFLHPVVSVSGSGWWFKYGNWCFVLVPCYVGPMAALIVCSTRGFACIRAKWFWPSAMSLFLTYGSPEVSCNKRADTYFGRRSTSLMKEFWTLCILLMTDSETLMGRNNPIFAYWFCTLFVDL